MNKTYIGDGVYVELTQWGDLELTTDNGTSIPSNRIVIDPQALAELVAFRERAINELKGNTT